MKVLALLPLLALLSTTPSSTASSTAVCTQLRPLLNLKDDALLAQAPQAWAALPTAMAQRLRADATTSLSSAAMAIEPTRRAIAMYCPTAVPDARLALERVHDLGRDERFTGVRNDDDLGDSLVARFGAWLEQLLESDAMVAFSEQTRTVYLSLLAIVSVVVAWRLRRRPPPRSTNTTAAEHRLHQQRAVRVDELLAHAVSVLDHDPRRGSLLLRQALLVRVGEVQHDDDVLSPSRTTSEVCGHLPADAARVVRPVLSHFDRIYFGSSTTTQEVLHLREDVMSALQLLVTR